MDARDALYDHAEDHIIERGRNYFLAGKILSLTRSDDFIFEATVQGTDLYSVEVGFNIYESTLFQWDCDCPYNGNLCKHVAAVVFQIVEDPDGIGLNTETKKVSLPYQDTTEEILTTNSYKESVEEVLNSIPLDKLKSFVRSAANEDKNLAKRFILLFPEYLSVLPKKYYSDKIREIVNGYKSKNNFLDHKSSSAALKEIRKMFESVKKKSKTTDVTNLILCATAIISTLSEISYLFSYTNSESNSLIVLAELELKDTARQAAKDNALREKMLKLLLEQISEDSHPERQSYQIIISLTAKLINSEAEVNRLMAAVGNSIIPMKYKEEQLKVLLSLIEEYKNESEVLRFLAKHWEYPMLREEKIKAAIKAKNYKKAALFAEEGIKATPKNHDQISGMWYSLLLKISILQKEDNKILNLAVQTLSITGFDHKTNPYTLLRKYIGQTNWNQFLETLINGLQNDPSNFDLIAQIYIRENWGQRLLGHLMLKPELEIISNYDSFLSQEFREELSLLYSGAITFNLQEAKTRGEYRDILHYIKKVKKFGGLSSALALKEELLQKFERRSVLVAELSKLHFSI